MSIIDITDPKAATTAEGIIGELMRAQVLGLEGRVTVEIVDEGTGKVLDRLDSENYVNTGQWQQFAKALQKLIWTFGYQGDTTTVTNDDYTNRDPRYVPTLRNDHLACWTDATAEDATDKFPFGEIVAWAHRWQQGSPSTRQGIVNPTLCTLSASSVKWVWEWTTSAGNGTFQSVGWRRLGVSSNSGDAILRDMPHISRKLGSTTGFSGDPSSSTTASCTFTSGSTNQQATAVYYDSGSGKLYFITPAAAGVKLCSTPLTIGSSGDYTLGAVTDESAAAFAAGVGGDTIAIATRLTCGFTRMGAAGDWVAAGFSGTSGSGRRPFIRRVTNAGALVWNNVNAGTYAVESVFLDVTYDGTNLWVAAQNGNTGVPAIHRIDPATGTISATITTIANVPTYFPALGVARGVGGIEWDAVNSWFWVTTTDGHLFNMDSSGNWLGVLMFDTHNEMPIAAATLSGQHNGTRMAVESIVDTDQVNLVVGAGGSTSQTWPGNQSAIQVWTDGSVQVPPNTRARIITMDGDIWAQGFISNNTNGTPTGISKLDLKAFTQYPNFATRSLLGAPATKNNTQTMRIAYTITFV